MWMYHEEGKMTANVTENIAPLIFFYLSYFQCVIYLLCIGKSLCIKCRKQNDVGKLLSLWVILNSKLEVEHREKKLDWAMMWAVSPRFDISPASSCWPAVLLFTLGGCVVLGKLNLCSLLLSTASALPVVTLLMKLLDKTLSKWLLSE